MRVRDVRERLNSFAHEDLSVEYVKAYSGYDNTGFLLGDEDMEVLGILLTVDITDEVISNAIESGVNLIVSHHPFIYNPINSVQNSNAKGGQIIRLIKNDIAVISAHLSLDCAVGGINDVLCDMLHGRNRETMYPLSVGGLGRVFDIDEITLAALTRQVAGILDDKTVFAKGREHQAVNRVAVICGGGGDDSENLILASKMGADCYISADFKHHILMLAGDMGLSVVSASHCKMEEIILPVLSDLFADLCEKIIIYKSNPYI